MKLGPLVLVLERLPRAMWIQGHLRLTKKLWPRINFSLEWWPRWRS